MDVYVEIIFGRENKHTHTYMYNIYIFIYIGIYNNNILYIYVLFYVGTTYQTDRLNGHSVIQSLNYHRMYKPIIQGTFF